MRNILNKKFLAFCLTILCGALFLTSCYTKVNQELEIDFEWDEAQQGYVVEKYTGENSKITIVQTWKKKPVVEIAEEAFLDNTTLETINIPSSINVADRAFKGCTALKDINFTATDTTNTVAIGEEAFAGCVRLSNINLSSNVTSIGKEAFKGCTTVRYYQVPTTVTEIGADAFADCTMLVLYTANATAPEGYDATWTGSRPTYYNATPSTYSSNNTVFHYIIVDDKIIVTRFIGTDNESVVVIPEKINNTPITEIGDYAFAYTDEYYRKTTSFSIKNITLPGAIDTANSTVTTPLVSVGAHSFIGCTKVYNTTTASVEEKTSIVLLYCYFETIPAGYTSGWYDNLTVILYAFEEPADSSDVYYWHDVNGTKTIYRD